MNNGHPLKTLFITLSAGIGVIALLAVIGVSIIGANFFRGTKAGINDIQSRIKTTRDEIPNKYSKLSLSDGLTLTKKTQVGDGFDSAPGWEYDYRSNKDQQMILNNTKNDLKSQGFLITDEAASSFLAKNSKVNLHLRIYYSTDNHLFVTVTEINW